MGKLIKRGKIKRFDEKTIQNVIIIQNNYYPKPNRLVDTLKTVLNLLTMLIRFIVVIHPF